MSIKKLNNRAGMIMLVALTFIMIMSIIVAGIFSRNISSNLSALSKVKRIKAEMLARGEFWRAYNELYFNGSMPPNAITDIDGVSYTVTFARNTVPDPDAITVTVTYPD